METNQTKTPVRFKTFDSVTLFDKQLERRKYTVEGLIPEGLVMLAGPSKTGKSFFVLDLCAKVAAGEPFLGFPTTKGTVLYLCFEDDEKRIQDRQFGLMDEGIPGLYFCNDKTTISEGIIQKMEQFVSDHPDTQLIVIDTLKYVRDADNRANVYDKDYDDLIPLHEFTMRHPLSLVVVHHTNKNQSGDEYEQASGSTGLTGSVDEYFLLRKDKRGERNGTLFISGRDILEATIKLKQGENGYWEISDDTKYEKTEMNLTVCAIALYLSFSVDLDDVNTFTATELSCKLREEFGMDFPATTITKNLTAHHGELKELGFVFENTRTGTKRSISFMRTEDYKTPRMCFGENGFLLPLIMYDENEAGTPESICEAKLFGEGSDNEAYAAASSEGASECSSSRPNDSMTGETTREKTTVTLSQTVTDDENNECTEAAEKPVQADDNHNG